MPLTLKIALIIGIWCLQPPLAVAFEFSELPDSERVLSRQEVKNFWLHQVRSAPVSSRPLGLEPQKQRAWDVQRKEQRELAASIRKGDYDLEARRVQLLHNVEAWRLLGEEEKSQETERQLFQLREHLARLETLKAQKLAAEKIVQTIEEAKESIGYLEVEIGRLRQEILSNCP